MATIPKVRVPVEAVANEAVELMQFFKFKHLTSARLRQTSEPFCLLAEKVFDTIPDHPERTAALRKLLEAKDCAVRAALTDE